MWASLLGWEGVIHPLNQAQATKCAMVKMVNSLFPPQGKTPFSRSIRRSDSGSVVYLNPHADLGLYRTQRHTEEIYWTDISFFSVLLYFLTNNPYFLTRTRLIGPSSATSNPVNLLPLISSSPRRTNDRYTKHHTHVLPSDWGWMVGTHPHPIEPDERKKINAKNRENTT